MSNATQAKLHYNIVLESMNKLGEHRANCPLCKEMLECGKNTYFIGEMQAAQLVYKDTVNRWLAKESLISEIPECPHHCPE
jgi:hypothetical protein